MDIVMDDANVGWIMDNGFVCDVLWMVDVYVMGYGCVCDISCAVC